MRSLVHGCPLPHRPGYWLEVDLQAQLQCQLQNTNSKSTQQNTCALAACFPSHKTTFLFVTPVPMSTCLSHQVHCSHNMYYGLTLFYSSQNSWSKMTSLKTSSIDMQPNTNLIPNDGSCTTSPRSDWPGLLTSVRSDLLERESLSLCSRVIFFSKACAMKSVWRRRRSAGKAAISSMATTSIVLKFV